jgi:uncharacterized membrane-anchored protein YhcB (DUF1043 family)
METIHFVLGLLTMVSIALVVGIVVGMLKIGKLTNQVNSLSVKLDRDLDDMNRHMDSGLQTVWRQFEDTGRDITMVERTIMQRIDSEFENTSRRLDREIEEAHRHIEQEVQAIHQHEHEIEQSIHRDIEETRRYIDSRIDKTVLSGSMKSSKPKSVING